MYIKSKSNHPPPIMRQLPVKINKTISDISYSEDEFERAKRPYESVANKSVFNISMNFIRRNTSSKQKRKRQWKIIWLNPRSSHNIETNIEKMFPKLICKNFPRSHRFSKKFNTNTMEVLIKEHKKNVRMYYIKVKLATNAYVIGETRKVVP